MYGKPDLLLQIENEHYKDKSRTLNFDPIDTFWIHFIFCLIKRFHFILYTNSLFHWILMQYEVENSKRIIFHDGEEWEAIVEVY